jgi:hypothetical protein
MYCIIYSTTKISKNYVLFIAHNHETFLTRLEQLFYAWLAWVFSTLQLVLASEPFNYCIST